MKTTSRPHSILLALLVVALLGFATSCETPMTPEEEARVAELDSKIDAQTADLEALEARVVELGKVLADGDASNDPAAIADLEAIQARYEEIANGVEADLKARGAVLDQARERAVMPAAQGLAAIFPQWGAVILAAAGIGSRLIPKRSREHLGASAVALIRGHLSESVKALLRAYGYGHSNQDPLAVLGGAEAAALESGTPEEALEIRAFRVKLEDRRLSTPREPRLAAADAARAAAAVPAVPSITP